MNFRNTLAAVLVLGLAGSALAKKAPVTLEVVGETTGKILVNGVEYVPGTPVKSGAKITVTGSATIRIGGSLIKTGDSATFRLSGNNLRVLEGRIEVTNSYTGQTQVVAQGEKAKIVAPAQTTTTAAAPTAESQQEAASEPPVNQPPPLPPASPKQNVGVVSPSSP